MPVQSFPPAPFGPSLDQHDPVSAPDQEAQALGQEADAVPDGYVRADLSGHPVHALSAQRWRASHLRALTAGDLDTFAEGVLHPDDVHVWYEADPTQDEIGAWVSAVAAAGGEALGKSSGRTASSTRTARR